MENIGVYRLEFTDGCYYIGQSVNLKSRLKDHYRMLIEGNHHSYKLQEKYDKLKVLPQHTIVKLCNPEQLNSIEESLIDINNRLCLNVKAGGASNYGINAPTAKYYTSDIELAFLILVDNPGILHKHVADFVGIDINTIHDISAGRNRVFTEIKDKYPDKYSKLINMKAANTRGKYTIVLEHTDGRVVTLITGKYSEFCKLNGVQNANLSKVISGDRKATMGWKLIEKYENV